MKVTVSKTPTYVVDASIILGSILPDEILPSSISNIITKFTLHQVNFIVPEIINYEVANSLKSAVLQKRLSPTKATQILERFLLLPLKFQSLDFPNALKLAIKHQFSFYDAAYISLAQSLRAPLLSLDQKLSKMRIP